MKRHRGSVLRLTKCTYQRNGTPQGEKCAVAFRLHASISARIFPEPFSVDCVENVRFQQWLSSHGMNVLSSTDSCDHVSLNVACCSHPGVWGLSRTPLRMTALGWRRGDSMRRRRERGVVVSLTLMRTQDKERQHHVINGLSLRQQSRLNTFTLFSVLCSTSCWQKRYHVVYINKYLINVQALLYMGTSSSDNLSMLLFFGSNTKRFVKRCLSHRLHTLQYTSVPPALVVSQHTALFPPYGLLSLWIIFVVDGKNPCRAEESVFTSVSSQKICYSSIFPRVTSPFSASEVKCGVACESCDHWVDGNV